MEEHAAALAQGLRAAQLNTLRGALDVKENNSEAGNAKEDGGALAGATKKRRRPGSAKTTAATAAPASDDPEDEEEYQLRRQLQEMERELRRRRSGLGRRSQHEPTQEPPQEPPQEQEQEQATSDAAVRAELLVHNTTSFLKTIQHKDIKNTDQTFYQMEGFDKNMPLPVSAQAESVQCLEEMLGALREATKVTFTELKRVQLPDMQHTSWEVAGRATVPADWTSAESSAESSAETAEPATFRASFLVDEAHSRMTGLKVSVSEDAEPEMRPVLDHCERTSCFRTFCDCFGEYGQFALHRRRLVRCAVGQHPASCKALPFSPAWGLDVDADVDVDLDNIPVLRVSRPDCKAFLVWHAAFQLEGGRNRNKDTEEGRAAATGHTLRTHAQLFLVPAAKASKASKASKQKRQASADFGALVKHQGFPAATDTFVRAFTATDQENS